MSLLDELVLVPAPLAPLSPLGIQGQSTFSLGGNSNSRPLQIGGPWIVGQTSPAQAGGQWIDLCARLSERSLLLECAIAALEKLPVAAIPRRIFRQRVGTSLKLNELQSADVVEVTCQLGTSNVWGWPPEVDSIEHMESWLGAVRHVIGKNTPFGLGISAGVDEKSIQAITNWSIDFVTLYAEGAIELLVESISKLRTQFKALDRRIPIFVRTPTKRLDHLVKIISLGAAAVTIDGYLADLWPQTTQSSSSGFLGTRLPATAGSNKNPIGVHLDTLYAKLTETMQATRCGNTNELAISLRALTPTAARLARIPMIGELH